MATENSVQYTINPEVPKMLSNEQINVYVPIATENRPGIASFYGSHFAVDAYGNVQINRDILAIFGTGKITVPDDLLVGESGLIGLSNSNYRNLHRHLGRFVDGDTLSLDVDPHHIQHYVLSSFETHNEDENAHPFIRGKISNIETDLTEYKAQVENRFTSEIRTINQAAATETKRVNDAMSAESNRVNNKIATDIGTHNSDESAHPVLQDLIEENKISIEALKSREGGKANTYTVDSWTTLRSAILRPSEPYINNGKIALSDLVTGDKIIILQAETPDFVVIRYADYPNTKTESYQGMSLNYQENGVILGNLLTLGVGLTNIVDGSFNNTIVGANGWGKTNGSNAIALGGQDTLNPATAAYHSIAMGNAKASYQSIVLASDAYSVDFSESTSSSLIIGNGDRAEGLSIIIGEDNKRFYRSAVFGNNNEAKGERQNFIFGSNNQTVATQGYTFGNDNYIAASYDFTIGNHITGNSDSSGYNFRHGSYIGDVGTIGSHNFMFGYHIYSGGNYGFNFGYQNTISMLYDYGLIFGSNNNLNGSYSVAIGEYNTINADSCLAFGTDVTVHGNYGVGIGLNLLNRSAYGLAFGQNITNSGYSSITFGECTQSGGDGEPVKNHRNSGNYSLMLGRDSENMADYSIVQGNNNFVSGSHSLVLGDSIVYAGENALILGKSITSDGASFSLINTQQSYIYTYGSLVVGNNHHVNMHSYVDVVGQGLTTNNDYAQVRGQYNNSSTYLFTDDMMTSQLYYVFGNGEDTGSRKNLFEIGEGTDLNERPFKFFGIGTRYNSENFQSPYRDLSFKVALDEEMPHASYIEFGRKRMTAAVFDKLTKFAEKYNTTNYNANTGAFSVNAFSYGNTNMLKGEHSAVFGDYINTNSAYEFVTGKYNETISGTAYFSIGAGSATIGRYSPFAIWSPKNSTDVNMLLYSKYDANKTFNFLVHLPDVLDDEAPPYIEFCGNRLDASKFKTLVSGIDYEKLRSFLSPLTLQSNNQGFRYGVGSSIATGANGKYSFSFGELLSTQNDYHFGVGVLNESTPGAAYFTVGRGSSAMTTRKYNPFAIFGGQKDKYDVSLLLKSRTAAGNDHHRFEVYLSGDDDECTLALGDARITQSRLKELATGAYTKMYEWESGHFTEEGPLDETDTVEFDTDQFATVIMRRSYEGNVLDISNVTLSGAIGVTARTPGLGKPSTYIFITHDITKHLQSIPAGYNRTFPISGVIRDDSNGFVHYCLNVRIFRGDGVETISGLTENDFAICIVPEMSGGDSIGVRVSSTSGGVLYGYCDNMRVRCILASEIKQIGTYQG